MNVEEKNWEEFKMYPNLEKRTLKEYLRIIKYNLIFYLRIIKNRENIW
jgi:hypothetical protein